MPLCPYRGCTLGKWPSSVVVAPVATYSPELVPTRGKWLSSAIANAVDCAATPNEAAIAMAKTARAFLVRVIPVPSAGGGLYILYCKRANRGYICSAMWLEKAEAWL